MCGIFFACSPTHYRQPSERLMKYLERRGPDSVRKITRTITEEPEQKHLPWFLSATSSVLSLRSEEVISQPLEDREWQSGSFLCWNGEAWRFNGKLVRGYDVEVVFRALLEAARMRTLSPLSNSDCPESAPKAVFTILEKISGPYAFVFYDDFNRLLFYGRDALGRRSLLIKTSPDHSIEIASSRGEQADPDWAEVEANGLNVLDLSLRAPPEKLDSLTMGEKRLPSLIHMPWTAADGPQMSPNSLTSPFPYLNRETRYRSVPLTFASPATETLLRHLKCSLNLRLAARPIGADTKEPRNRIAILFSGGLDCTVIARLAHELMPDEEEIDLLNVAFENPRILNLAARNEQATPDFAYELCPDRITGRSSHAELARLCPGRKWRFVAINVPYSETIAHRAEIMTLLHPHNTEMDLSIGCALYFAARGCGSIQNQTSAIPSLYSTPARVLLSGLGADELFGGYTRHSKAFDCRGFPGLVDELHLDFQRLGKRNLGRDDRVISNWGKEVRYPYLDEELVGWALSVPVWEKCGFGQTTEEKPGLEPDKKVLRLLAWKLGLRGPATERKRAIQFGARTAKMESGKTKGTQIIN